MCTVQYPSGIALSLLLTSLCCLTGCENGGHFSFFGYTTKPTFDNTIRTVYVPIAENTSYRMNLEFELTKMVQRELTAFNSPYRLVSNRDRADSELLMKIVNRRKTTLLLNQRGEARDAEIGLTIQLVWRDLRPGHIGDILSNPKRFDPNELPLPGEPRTQAPKEIPILIMPVTNYVPELGGSTAVAEFQAVQRAAQQIIQLMEVWPK